MEFDDTEITYWLDRFLVMPALAILDVPAHVYEFLHTEKLIAHNGELTELGLTYV